MPGCVAETGTGLNEHLALGAMELPNDELLANEARIKEITANPEKGQRGTKEAQGCE